MATEKRLIDANALIKLGEETSMAEALPDWHDLPASAQDAACRHGEYLRKLIEGFPTVDAVEVSKLGKLGQLMMPYNGCPRGRIGKRGAPGDGTDTPQLMELDAIVDIDGNRWVPVLADDLEEFKKAIWKLAYEKGGCNG